MPLLPREPADGEDHVRARRRPAVAAEPLDVDPWRRDFDLLRRDALEEQGLACPLGRCEKEIGLPDDATAVAAREQVPVRLEERNRLPDGEHEAVAAMLLRRRLQAPPGKYLGRVHDV